MEGQKHCCPCEKQLLQESFPKLALYGYLCVSAIGRNGGVGMLLCSYASETVSSVYTISTVYQYWVYLTHATPENRGQRRHVLHCSLFLFGVSVWKRLLAGILEQSMGAKNRAGRGLYYRPARLHRLAELIPWNRLQNSLIVYKFGFWNLRIMYGG